MVSLGQIYEEIPIQANNSLQNYITDKTTRILTSRVMQIEFGMTQYSAQKWLNLFVEKGLIVKDGTHHSPIYLKA